MKLHKFTIDRSKWLNGYSMLKWNSPSQLCDRQDRMCCVGFLAESYGMAKEVLLERSTLENCQDPKLVPIGECALGWFYRKNDSPAYTCSEREKMLSETFRHYDIEVEFVGEYPE